MATKKRDSNKGLWRDIKTETWQAVSAIVCFVLAFVALLASFGKAGFIGFYAYEFLDRLLGKGYFLLPILFLMLGGAFLKGLQRRFELAKFFGALLFFLCGLGLIGLLPGRQGGDVGVLISSPLIKLVDIYATTILLFAGAVIAVLVIFETHFTLESLAFWKWFGAGSKDDKKKNAKKLEMDAAEKLTPEEEEEKLDRTIKAIQTKIDAERKNTEKTGDKSTEKTVLPAALQKEKKLNITASESDKMDMATTQLFKSSGKPFVAPPLSLLEKDKGRPETGDIKANANIIKRTLQNFGINVEMDEISIGPSVTRYALKPAEGVKLSKIVALNNDLALALAAHPIRIEAPIPGKSLVGIEIPNSTKTTVGLATLLGQEEYQSSEKPLLVSLGKSVTGKSYFANLAKAPHMLIAGATGSGKSVTIHAVINSLLFRNSPEALKFIMIDPKRVELTLYNNIPHLLTPVITEAKKAILALKWAAKEMGRRYDTLEKAKVRDIDSYHKGKGSEGESMPYIVVIIDELADIMQTYPRELESAIVRLAQMSRAVGIHLIISTQRPSVNVITGLIKANIPTRIALQVSSQIDSRTILDTSGAEKLLGAGDMLYLGGEMAKPARLQSAFISETEVKKVVKYLVSEYKDEVMGEINFTNNGAANGAAGDVGRESIFSADLEAGDDEAMEEDDMYEQARETVTAAGKASTSYIQRKLGVGYSRAAKLMDMLEERGVIGPANGSKPREVIGAENTGASGDGNDDTAVENTDDTEAAAGKKEANEDTDDNQGNN
jgi:S-DNA-T family DNA segregation ATPase FtsK/SpoIIIE